MTVLTINSIQDIPERLFSVTVLYWNIEDPISLSLPHGLRELHCNKVKKLPADIPETVTTLVCNSIEKLPISLHEGLERLSCNSVKVLRRIPSTVTQLSCNSVVNLKVFSSKSLRTLACVSATEISQDILNKIELLICSKDYRDQNKDSLTNIIHVSTVDKPYPVTAAAQVAA